MNKLFGSLLVIAFVTSCNTTERLATLSDIQGEWNVIEVKGSEIKTKPGEQQPYIGFDTKDGRIYGYSGCNRITATIDLNTQPGKIKLQQVGSTMMSCPDMETEQKILKALNDISGYQTTKEGCVKLCNSEDRTIIILKKRFFPMNFSELKGEWNIVTVLGDSIPNDMKTKTFLSFDTKEKRISGNAGCNNIFGNIETSEENKSSITFSSLGSTRMACPNMETEQKVMEAINNANTFGKLENESVAFYSKEGNEILVLKKK